MPSISYLLLYISAEKSEALDLGLVISHQNPLIRLGFYYRHHRSRSLLSSNAESLLHEFSFSRLVSLSFAIEESCQ